ncbi:phage portal protein, partial [Cupriavidus sp. SIMBA_020]
MALRVQAHINRDVLRARHGLVNVRFQFDGLDREDEMAIADIFKREYESNATTPNEYRASKGLEPLKSRWADLT